MAKPRPVAIRSETIELAQFLKFSGVADSGGGAKHAIVSGAVQVNGAVVTQRGRTLSMGDVVTWNGQALVVTVVR